MNLKKHVRLLLVVLAAALLLAVPAFAAGAPSGNVASVIESTWQAAKTQIQSVVNNVVFPAIDLILAVLLFVKLGTCYLDYRKHGQMEWTAPVILFVCLIFMLTAPLYIWTII